MEGGRGRGRKAGGEEGEGRKGGGTEGGREGEGNKGGREDGWKEGREQEERGWVIVHLWAVVAVLWLSLSMGCAHHCEWSGGGARPSLAIGGVMVGYWVWVLVTFWSLLWAVCHCLSWAVVTIVAGTYCCSAVCFLWWWVSVVGVHVCGELLVVAVGTSVTQFRVPMRYMNSLI